MIGVMGPLGDRRNGATLRVVGYKVSPRNISDPNFKSGRLPGKLFPGGTAMANRRFEMYQYRQVIFRMRMGQSDRTIARSGLMGRLKCAQVRAIARQNGWLQPVSLPEDDVLAGAFKKKAANPTHRSLIQPFAEQVIKWRQEGIWGTTIHQALVDKFDFTGSYSCVRRFLKKLQKDPPQVTEGYGRAMYGYGDVPFGLPDVPFWLPLKRGLDCHQFEQEP